MSEDNLIEFRPKGPFDTHFEVKHTDYFGCKHKGVTVDAKLRKVECRDCKVVLDPIEVLIDLAYEVRSVEGLKQSFDFKRFLKLEGLIRQGAKRNLMSEVELKMSPTELRAAHAQTGCPKARMWFDGKMVRCYCGVGQNMDFYPAIASDVRAAHEAIRGAQEPR